MKGIPVLPTGDDVRSPYVVAGSYQQFINWCRFSRVNPRSRNVRFVSDDHYLRGVRDIDLVFTGIYDDMSMSARGRIAHAHFYLQAVGAIANEYQQYESADIEPNVVEC